jgi:hypothetical protein
MAVFGRQLAKILHPDDCIIRVAPEAKLGRTGGFFPRQKVARAFRLCRHPGEASPQHLVRGRGAVAHNVGSVRP